MNLPTYLKEQSVITVILVKCNLGLVYLYNLNCYIGWQRVDHVPCRDVVFFYFLKNKDVRHSIINDNYLGKDEG